MPETAKSAAQFNDLTDELKSCETITDLFKLASSDAFRTASRSLPPDQLDKLRQVYKDCQTNLDGKVKLEQFDASIIRIIGVDWWHSEQWDNDGVTLRFVAEHDQAHRYKALTSSAPIVRFCNRFADTLPTPAAPVRVYIKLVPVRDVERAKAGQRQWTIKALPTVDGVTTGSPF